MNVIITAAGMGTRLGKYTQDLPKCMLRFKGKTLLERQIETLRACGLTDISVVRGYQAEKIAIPDVRYYQNDDFANTNVVESVFCAEQELKGDTLIAYSDIIYEPNVIKTIINSPADIGVTVDTNYWDYWNARLEEPEKDTESLIIGPEDTIVDLGNPHCTKNEASVRYVGLIKLSAKGVETLKTIYHQNKDLYKDSSQPWKYSKCFRKAYMTCLIQACIDAGHRVDPIKIEHGWMEFDTVDDYERALLWDEQGNLDRFIHLPDEKHP